MASPASSDEGEIVERVLADLKPTSPRAPERNGVDRQDRPRRRYSASRSPDRDRAPGGFPPDNRTSRSPRGYKRSRDDRDFRDHHGGRRGGGDPRRFRTHYEAAPGDYRRQRQSYNDLDQPSWRSANPPYYSRERDRDRDRDRSRDRYRDRDQNGYPDKRPRNGARSPPRRDVERRYDDRYDREDRRPERQGDYPRTVKYDEHIDRVDSVSRRAGEGGGSQAKNDAKPGKGHADEKRYSREDDSPQVNKETSEETYEEPEPFDEDAEIERRRKRREALLAKSNPATPLLVHALHASDKGAGSVNGSPQSTVTAKEYTASPSSDKGAHVRQTSSVSTPAAMSPASDGFREDSPMEVMGIASDKDLMNTHARAAADDEDGPSAADYDPTADMKADELKNEVRHPNVGLHGEKGPRPPIESSIERPADSAGTKDASEDDDDDDFNMFAEDFDVDKYATTQAGKAGDRDDEDGGAGGGMLDDVDKDGYYKIRIGETLNGRYQVQTGLGKGMFSGVVRALDITNNQLVAIKMMRNNDALKKGGFTEIAILQKLNEADPDNRKHIVRFIRHFDHKGHLCMIFENLSLNLREVLKKFGNNVGINLNATRAYAHQIFVALAHLRRCGIIHADLKPDNILVNESRNLLKICDLGTAIDRQDAATAHNEITPYLVSRFYRAPEIMLGMPYDFSIDMWSIGCTLYELYTGKILFTGDSNNQMLKSIMEIRGKIPPKTYRRGELAAMHFDEKGNFVSVERDKILGKTTIKTLPMLKPMRDLRTRLMTASAGMDDAEARELNHFVDLLEHCLALNPDRRMKPSEALKHPFFTSRIMLAKR